MNPFLFVGVFLFLWVIASVSWSVFLTREMARWSPRLPALCWGSGMLHWCCQPRSEHGHLFSQQPLGSVLLWAGSAGRNMVLGVLQGQGLAETFISFWFMLLSWLCLTLTTEHCNTQILALWRLHVHTLSGHPPELGDGGRCFGNPCSASSAASWPGPGQHLCWHPLGPCHLPKDHHFCAPFDLSVSSHCLPNVVWQDRVALLRTFVT